MSNPNFQPLSNFIWSVADLLRGPYRPPQYERVMLPMTVLRRFDCVLEHSKAQILAKHEAMLAKNKTLPEGKRINDFDPTLNKIAKDIDGRELGFHNHSPLNFQKLKGDPDNVGRHLQDYINGFSKNIREIFDKFEFDKEIEKMEDSNRLYLVVSKFAEIDLHPERVDNITMGLVFEDLIRRFNESANETAGDHFTPREVIRLMVNLLMEPDGDLLTNGSPIVTICDPACGTGGMLSVSQNWIREHNANAIVKVFGQDYNPRSYAVAASDLLIKGHKDSRITKGNTLTDPPFDDIEGFDYRRITIERPLRLRFQITDDAKEMFLNSCPELFDAIEAIEETMGTDMHMDWNTAWPEIQRIVKDCELGWAAGPDGTRQKKFFRDCFTETDTKAEPVIAKLSGFPKLDTAVLFPIQTLPKALALDELQRVCGYFPETKGKKGKAVEYEADSRLRDNENMPLKEDIVSFFLREFFHYEEPRSLKEIDKELALVEKRILKMLQEVTE